MQVDDDDVDPAPRGGDRGGHSGGVEDVGVERRVRQSDDLHPALMPRGDVIQTLDRAAVGLVAPAVSDGPDAFDPE